MRDPAPGPEAGAGRLAVDSALLTKSSRCHRSDSSAQSGSKRDCGNFRIRRVTRSERHARTGAVFDHRL